jgi:hypothetical protein
MITFLKVSDSVVATSLMPQITGAPILRPGCRMAYYIQDIVEGRFSFLNGPGFPFPLSYSSFLTSNTFKLDLNIVEQCQ